MGRRKDGEMSVSVKGPFVRRLHTSACLGWLPHGSTEAVVRVDVTGCDRMGPVKLNEDEVKNLGKKTGGCMEDSKSQDDNLGYWEMV